MAAICSKCRSGKHKNCDGTAIDEVLLGVVDCLCPPAFGHDPKPLVEVTPDDTSGDAR